MSAAATVLSAALELSLHERADLAAELLESLDGEPGLSPDEWTDSWTAELGLRLEALRAGELKLIPHDVVMAEVREKLKQLKRG